MKEEWLVQSGHRLIEVSPVSRTSVGRVYIQSTRFSCISRQRVFPSPRLAYRCACHAPWLTAWLDQPKVCISHTVSNETIRFVRPYIHNYVPGFDSREIGKRVQCSRESRSISSVRSRESSGLPARTFSEET